MQLLTETISHILSSWEGKERGLEHQQTEESTRLCYSLHPFFLKDGN